MTEVDFLCLTTHEKAQYIWAEGKFMGRRDFSGFQTLLYHLGKYYAEVLYSKEENAIIDITIMKDEPLLTLYGEGIDIHQLFNI